MISVAALKMQALMKGGMSMEDARNKCSVQMVRAAVVSVLHRQKCCAERVYILLFFLFFQKCDYTLTWRLEAKSC